MMKEYNQSFTERTLTKGKSRGPSKEVQGICIPSLPLNVSKNELYTRFRCLNIGSIRNIVIVKKEVIASAFITIDRWYKNKRSNHILSMFEAEQPVYICSSFPEYFKCIILKKKK